MIRREHLRWLASLGVGAFGAPGIIRSAVAQSGPPGMDTADREKLLALYPRFAENRNFLGKVAAALGFGTGEMMSVVQLVLTLDKTQWAFGHFEVAPEHFYFGHYIKDSGLPSRLFRVDREFRLIGEAVAWADGNAVKMSRADSVAFHAQQMKEWRPRIDALRIHAGEIPGISR